MRWAYGVLGLATVPAGLVVRFVPVGLPWWVVKYGGSTLWAAMVYWVLAFVWPRRSPVWLASVAGVVATLVEVQRLFHFRALDAFRMTLAGILLLGRFFSVWDIVAYWVAIALAALLDGLAVRHAVEEQRG
jgi:hypothetical protein